MNTPFSYSRRLKPYAEQVRDKRADEQRRARNRLIAAVAVLAVAAIVGYFIGG